MVSPRIEVTVTHVGSHTVEDDTTDAGRIYREAFYNAATGIPGCERGCWGRSDKYPDKVLHFLDYDTRKQHDVHKNQIGGPTPPILHDIQTDTHVYVIEPNTTEHTKVYYAPYTAVFFFWGINEDEFTKLAPEFFASIARSDATTGYIWGEVEFPVLSDPTGLSKLGSKAGVLITGWRSKDQFSRDMGKPRVTAAHHALARACKKTDNWGTSLTVTENTGHIHSWKTIFPPKDRSDWLPGAGAM